ncbi:unnamed protein product [Trichogramma brassicae]|uniref:Uncharacterized protein n=1 Tax=Trichogramma brassicae TaxID=86971 RepID=A0A6H5I2D6_9HYME|nr:unnamed protein product [Trichogramma brassicae]
MTTMNTYWLLLITYTKWGDVTTYEFNHLTRVLFAKVTVRLIINVLRQALFTYTWARSALASIVSRDTTLVGRANMAAARAIDATMLSARVPARRGTHVLIPAMRLVVQRGQSAPMLSARSRRQHTHTDALFTAYRRCGTRQSHSSPHTHAYARDPAVASTNNLDKNLKLTPNLRRLDVGLAPLLNYNLALVRASMVYVPAGCGLMPTSGRWSSMLVHSCTGSYNARAHSNKPF